MAGSPGVGPSVPQINIEIDHLDLPRPGGESKHSQRRASTESCPDAPAIDGLTPRSVDGRSNRSRASSAASATRARMVHAIQERNPAAAQAVGSLRAQRNLAKLVNEIPTVGAHQHHLSLVAQRFQSGEFSLPPVFGGTVTRDKSGRMRCLKDKAVDAVLLFAHEFDPEAAREVANKLPEAGVKVRLPLESGILVKAKAFDEGCTFLARDKEGNSKPIKMTNFALRRAMEEGAKAFGDEAHLNEQAWQRQMAARPRAQSQSKSGAYSAPEADLPDAAFRHPFEFLSDVHYEPQSDLPELQHLLEVCMNSRQEDALELRGKLGAVAIDSIINKKELKWTVPVAILASIAVAGGASYVLDELVWTNVARVARGAGYDLLADIIEIFGKGSTGFVAEGLDSGILGRFLGTLENEPLLWEDFDEFTDDLKDMAKAGAWSAVGQTAHNAAGLVPGWTGVAAQTATSAALVAPTSAALMPRLIAKMTRDMAQGVVHGYKTGMFAMPELPEGTDPEDPDAALSAVAMKEARLAVDKSRVGELSISAMGKGPWWSAATYLPFGIVTRMKLLNEVFASVASIVANTPTELYNVTFGTVKGMLTDHQKYQTIVQYVVDKAVKNMREGAAAPDTEEETLYEKEHPGNRATSTFRQGKDLVDAMNRIASWLTTKTAAMKRKENEELTFPIMGNAPGFGGGSNS